jgi:hypothetical protein
MSDCAQRRWCSADPTIGEAAAGRQCRRKAACALHRLHDKLDDKHLLQDCAAEDLQAASQREPFAAD